MTSKEEIKQLAETLLKKGISKTGLDAHRMAESMLEGSKVTDATRQKKIQELRARATAEVKRQEVPAPEPSLTQAMAAGPATHVNAQGAHTDHKEEIVHIRAVLDEQHQRIEHMLGQVSQMQDKLSVHDQKLDSLQPTEQAQSGEIPELVEEPAVVQEQSIPQAPQHQQEQPSEQVQEVAHELVEEAQEAQADPQVAMAQEAVENPYSQEENTALETPELVEEVAEDIRETSIHTKQDEIAELVEEEQVEEAQIAQPSLDTPPSQEKKETKPEDEVDLVDMFNSSK
ncbi:MAG: hypothetical protein ACI8Y7_000979 [Candidatus Woesearchaeota archaeon]|jgi:hypothetical protein